MIWIKKLWAKLGEEKFSGRAMTVGCTALTLHTLWTEPMSAAYAWVLGVMNGILILLQVIEEFKDDKD